MFKRKHKKQFFYKLNQKGGQHRTPYRNEGGLGFGPDLRGHEKLKYSKLS